MRSLLVTFVVLVVLTACGETSAPASAPTPARPLRIAAASSLTEVVPALAHALSLGPIEAHYEASSTLARQIELGDDVDLFLSADARWADHLVEAGLAVSGPTTAFASNRLVVVVPVEDTTAMSSLAALGSLEQVAVAGAEVPAGRLARAALVHEGILDALAPRLVDAPNVRGALAWVARGEAEAAIVFATDARVEPAVRVALEIPADTHPPAVDVGVVLRGEREAEAAAFLHALTTPAAQSVLAQAGFGAPP